MNELAIIGIAAFFIGVVGFGCFMGAADFMWKLHDKWKLEHDRRLRLEKGSAVLRKKYKASQALCEDYVRALESKRAETEALRVKLVASERRNAELADKQKAKSERVEKAV